MLSCAYLWKETHSHRSLLLAFCFLNSESQWNLSCSSVLLSDLLTSLFSLCVSSFSMLVLLICLSVGGTHRGFLPLLEHVCTNQPPVPDELIRRPLLHVVTEVHYLLDCWIMLLVKSWVWTLVCFPCPPPHNCAYRPSLDLPCPRVFGETTLVDITLVHLFTVKTLNMNTLNPTSCSTQGSWQCLKYSSFWNPQPNNHATFKVS